MAEQNRGTALSKKRKIVALGGILLLVAMIAILLSQARPIFTEENSPCIQHISVYFGYEGEHYTCNLSQSDGQIPDDLHDALVSLLLDAEMGGSALSHPAYYQISDGAVVITLLVQQDNSSSLLINLSNILDVSSVQTDNSYYTLKDHETLYQETYGLLADLLPLYAEKR